MAGRRVAASEGAHDAHGPGVERLDDLAALFRQPDGMPLALGDDGPQVAVAAGGAGSPWAIDVQRVAGSDRAAVGDVATIVLIRPIEDPADASVLQRALGSVLAHELRTPVTTIFGGAQLLADPTVMPTTKSEAARSVAREAHRLHRVVEDIVVLVRSARDPAPELEPVLLQRVLPAVVEAERAARPDVRIASRLPAGLPAVMADEAQVDQALTNILGAAIVYGSPTGTIQVSARRVDDAVEVSIVDDGPGRSAADASAAFELFHRSARTAADASGANLAMAVSRLLVTRMGGRIWARERAKGGEVIFSLPIADGMAWREERPNRKDASSSDGRARVRPG